MVAHFDGKLMQDLSGRSKVDRIAVLVSYDGTTKFLGAPKVDTSSGANIADVVYQRLHQWNIIDQVKGLSFDTTASNTGINTGAVVLLENKMARKLIHLPCRHHIYEIMLRAVFEIKYSSTSAPEVPIFERFAKSWPALNQESFSSGTDDEIVCSKISSSERKDILEFCNNQLIKSHSREDYKEMIQLALTFLGEGHFNFKTPGATSHARWMSKAIYCFKIFLFRDQFALSKKEKNGLRDICIFLIKIYLKVWFGSTSAISAPLQDLNFIKDMIQYSETDSEISAAIMKKMCNHLWYNAGFTVALAFFDSKVSYEEKRKMVKNLRSKEPVVKLVNGRKHSNLMDFQNYTLSDFVSDKTKGFFNQFGLSLDFLKLDPSTWETTFDFEEGWSFCQDLFVVNDTAERGVKFIQDYNKILTNDEDELQLILQMVEAYRKKYPSFKKSDLMR